MLSDKIPDGTQLELFADKETRLSRGFGRFGEATKKQKKLALKLGLDLEGVPKNVAEVMVGNFILSEFFGKKKINTATQKQVDFGKKFNMDFSGMPSKIAFAYIKNLLWELNFIIIDQQQLKPGIWTINIHNHERRQILSIGKNGLVKFTDTQRPARYARALLRYAAPDDGKPAFIRHHLEYQTDEQLLSRLYNCVLHEVGADA